MIKIQLILMKYLLYQKIVNHIQEKERILKDRGIVKRFNDSSDNEYVPL